MSTLMHTHSKKVPSQNIEEKKIEEIKEINNHNNSNNNIKLISLQWKNTMMKKFKRKKK